VGCNVHHHTAANRRFKQENREKCFAFFSSVFFFFCGVSTTERGITLVSKAHKLYDTPRVMQKEKNEREGETRKAPPTSTQTCKQNTEK
jgi:hypothetical protein